MNELERELVRLAHHTAASIDFADVTRRARRIRRRRASVAGAIGASALAVVIGVGISRSPRAESTADVIGPQPSEQLTVAPRPWTIPTSGRDRYDVDTTVGTPALQTLPSAVDTTTIAVVNEVATSPDAAPSTVPLVSSTTSTSSPPPEVTDVGVGLPSSSAPTVPPADAPLMSDSEAVDVVTRYFDALANGRYDDAAVLLGQGGLEESERPDLAHLYPELPREVSRTLADRLETWCVNQPSDCQPANVVAVEAIPYTYRLTVELDGVPPVRAMVLVTWFEGYLGIQWPTSV